LTTQDVQSFKISQNRFLQILKTLSGLCGHKFFPTFVYFTVWVKAINVIPFFVVVVVVALIL